MNDVFRQPNTNKHSLEKIPKDKLQLRRVQLRRKNNNSHFEQIDQ